MIGLTLMCADPTSSTLSHCERQYNQNHDCEKTRSGIKTVTTYYFRRAGSSASNINIVMAQNMPFLIYFQSDISNVARRFAVDAVVATSC